MEVSPKFSSIFNKPVDALSIHIDLPRLARNITINGLKPPSRSNDTPIRSLCFEIIQLLSQKLDSTQMGADTIETFLCSLPQDSHLPTDLLRLFHQPFFSDTRSLRVLKACTQSLLAPVITLLKSHLEASILSFNSFKNSWRLALSTQRMDQVKVQHVKKEMASPESETIIGAFTFEWTAIFSFDLDVRRITDVDIVLLTVELEEDPASQELLSSILEEAFENILLLLDEDMMIGGGHTSLHSSIGSGSTGAILTGHLSLSAATGASWSSSMGNAHSTNTRRGLSANAFAKTVESRVRKLKDRREKREKLKKKALKKKIAWAGSSSAPSSLQVPERDFLDYSPFVSSVNIPSKSQSYSHSYSPPSVPVPRLNLSPILKSASESGSEFEKHKRPVSSATSAKTDYSLSNPSKIPPYGRRLRSEEVIIASSINSPRDLRILQAIERKASREEIEDLFESGSSVHSSNSNGQRPLHVAAAASAVEIASFLLHQSADPNATDSRKWTPLHIAADNGLIQICELLLQYGAKAGIENDEGSLALHYFVRYSFKEEELEEAIHLLANLCRGVNINHQNLSGETPLHYCCHHLSFVQLLLSLGASCNIPNRRGQTPYQIIKMMKKLEFINIMLNHGAVERLDCP